MITEIYKIEQIGKGFLAVMAKPVAGEWIEEEIFNLANQGVNQIVSLLEDAETFEVGLQDEKQLSEVNGMEFISFPIKDRGLPKTTSEFSFFTRNLYDQISSGKNTVIHCRAGIGRSGLVAAGILLHYGFKPDAAFELISSKRRVRVPDTEEQRNWLKENCSLIVGNFSNFNNRKL